MEYVLLIVITIVNGYVDLGPLWSQLLLLPALLLSYSIGFGNAKTLYAPNTEAIWAARIFFVLYILQELALVYRAVKSLFVD